MRFLFLACLVVLSACDIDIAQQGEDRLRQTIENSHEQVQTLSQGFENPVEEIADIFMLSLSVDVSKVTALDVATLEPFMPQVIKGLKQVDYQSMDASLESNITFIDSTWQAANTANKKMLGILDTAGNPALLPFILNVPNLEAFETTTTSVHDWPTVETKPKGKIQVTAQVNPRLYVYAQVDEGSLADAYYLLEQIDPAIADISLERKPPATDEPSASPSQ